MLNSFYFPTKPTPPERPFPPHFQSTFPISLRWMCDWMSWTEKNYIKLCAMKALSTWSGVESWDGKTLCCRHGESRDRTQTYNENKFFSFLKQKKLINIKTNCSFVFTQCCSSSSSAPAISLDSTRLFFIYFTVIALKKYHRTEPKAQKRSELRKLYKIQFSRTLEKEKNISENSMRPCHDCLQSM